MSLSISIPKTAEQIPLDGLLALTRTAFGLGIGMLVADKIKPARPAGHGDRAGFRRRARRGSVAGEGGAGANQSAGIRARQPQPVAFDPRRFRLSFRDRRLLSDAASTSAQRSRA